MADKTKTAGTQETTGHEWDGIQELNNPLPKWWLYVFYATILFSVVWAALYPSVPYMRSHFAGLLGYTQREEVAKNLREAAGSQAIYRDRIQNLDVTAVREDDELRRFAVAGGRVLLLKTVPAATSPAASAPRAIPA